MILDIKGVEPVVIALERIEVEGGVRFTGLDLDSGANVVVTVERSIDAQPMVGATHDVSGLVLVLTLARTPVEA